MRVRFGVALAGFVLMHLMVMSGDVGADTAPEGPVILSVTGLEGPRAQVDFDQALLAGLPAATFETTTIWTEGPQSFTGVPFAMLLDHLSVSEGTVRMIAANDYAVEMPVAEVLTGEAMIAYLQNGAPMSLRDRGPLWVVYPYDADPELRTELVYSRSVWQLVRLEVLP